MAADDYLDLAKRKRDDRDAALDVERAGEMDELQRVHKRLRGQDLRAVSKSMDGNQTQSAQPEEPADPTPGRPKDQVVQERFAKAKALVEGWNQCYADIDLSNISSVDIIIHRWEGGLRECDIERRKEKANLPNPDDHRYSKLHAKIAYELSQLKRQRKLLVSQSLKPQQILQDLVDRRVHYDPQLRFNPEKDIKRADRTTVRVSISLSHVWGLHKDECEELERIFNVKTLSGSASAIVWLKQQIHMLFRSPYHSQPASPYRLKKSQLLEDAQNLLAKSQADHVKLEQRSEKRPLADHPDETRRILIAMARTDYTGFESSLEVVDKRTNIQTTYPRWSRPAPLDIKKPFPTTYFEKLTYAAALVLRPDKIVRQQDARDGYAFETAKYKYRVFAHEDDKDRAKVDPVSNEAYVRIKREPFDEDDASMVDRSVVEVGGSNGRAVEGSSATGVYWDLRQATAPNGTNEVSRTMGSTPEYFPPPADVGRKPVHPRAKGWNKWVNPAQTRTSRVDAPGNHAATGLRRAQLLPPRPAQLPLPRPTHPQAAISAQHVDRPEIRASRANAPRDHATAALRQPHPLPPRPASPVTRGSKKPTKRERIGGQASKD